MKNLACITSVFLISFASAATAEPPDALQPSLFLEINFGAFDKSRDLHFGAMLRHSESPIQRFALHRFEQYEPTRGFRTEATSVATSVSRLGLIKLDFYTRGAFTLSIGNVPLVGYVQALSAHETESSKSGWFANNWGWALAGAAVVGGAAIAAGSSHGGGGINTQNANQCQVTVVGSPPTNLGGCPKS